MVETEERSNVAVGQGQESLSVDYCLDSESFLVVHLAGVENYLQLRTFDPQHC